MKTILRNIFIRTFGSLDGFIIRHISLPLRILNSKANTVYKQKIEEFSIEY